MTKTPSRKPSQHYNSFTRWVVDGGSEDGGIGSLAFGFMGMNEKKNLMYRVHLKSSAALSSEGEIKCCLPCSLEKMLWTMQISWLMNSRTRLYSKRISFKSSYQSI